MGDQNDVRVDGAGQDEFVRLVQGHVSDIRALTIFYRRHGHDIELLESCLIEAAETLREVAHGVPARRSLPREGSDKVVLITSAAKRGGESSNTAASF